MGNGFEGKSGSRKPSNNNSQKGAPEAWLKGKEKSSAVCTKCVTGTGSAQLLAEEAVERTEGPWIHKADTASAVKEFTL